jgi:hypothetical protein
MALDHVPNVADQALVKIVTVQEKNNIMSITPKQLLETLQVLLPALSKITKSSWTQFTDMELPFHDTYALVEVDWGDTTIYPPIPKWRPATVDDIKDPPLTARFTDNDPAFEKNTWRHNGYLTGYTKTITNTTFHDEDEDEWNFCEVEDTSTQPYNDLLKDALPIDTLPKNDFNTVWLFMGGKWITGSKGGIDQGFWSNGESMSWDEANQPTHWKPYKEGDE